MKSLALLCLVGYLSIALCDHAPEPEININIDEILRKITTELLNSRTSSNGFYEVGDDGAIHFISNEKVKETPVSSTTTITTTTPEPSLLDDESEKDFVYDDADEDTLWEFLPRPKEMYDPLRSPEFPLIDTNEVEDKSTEKKVAKTSILERRRRDVKVDVGGQGGGSGGVDVAVNKPGSNVAVNVGNIQDLLSQFGIHFKGKPSGGAGSSYYGGSSSGGVDVNVNKPGHNVDVNVGGGGGGAGGVNVQKPNKGSTNVNVDWASFIPFVNVGVNKGTPGNKVDVNVGQGGGSLVDVKVNKGHNNKIPQPHELSAEDNKRVDVDLRAPFVDVKVDGEHDGPFPPRPPHHPHHPPKKHHKHHSHSDEDKNVSVNVGGGSWWPFVNVNVDNEASAGASQGKSSRPKKCVDIRVPFVNVILNRGCKELDTGDSSASASASASASVSS